MNTTCTKS